jgi:glycosyltransferase involved in cell wall biosynthesis
MSNPDPYDLDATISKCIKSLPANNKLSGFGLVFWDPSVYPRFTTLFNRSNSILVGYLIFEWTKLTKEYINNALLMDYLAVPSPWHREVLMANGIPSERIIILKAGLNKTYSADLKEGTRRKKFLFVGKYEKRKAVDECLSGFANAIKRGEGTLTLLLSDPHDPHFEVNRLPIIGKTSNIIPGIPPTTVKGMAELYEQHQYILVPSRAGGIELPLIEAMSRGCVPIVTKASGMEHYLPANWDWFIPVKSMVPMYDNRWFPPTTNWGVWAEPDWNMFEQLLIKASKTKPEAESALVRLHSTSQFDYPTIVRDLLRWYSQEDRKKVGVRL